MNALEKRGLPVIHLLNLDKRDPTNAARREGRQEAPTYIPGKEIICYFGVDVC